MKDKKMLKKILKSKLVPFSKKHDFKFYKPIILVKDCGSILQIINFDILSEGFNCNIAVQPLYIPSEELDLSFGNRLNYFKTKEEGIWGYGDNQDKIEKDLDRVIELLESNAIPWFDEVSTPSEIVTFISEGKANDTDMIVGFPQQIRSKFLGFSHLYEGEYKLAKDALICFVEFYQGDTRKWVIDEVTRIEELINVSKSNPSNILSILNQYIELTKKNLKITR
jgi:hypothetical protein